MLVQTVKVELQVIGTWDGSTPFVCELAGVQVGVLDR
jgi:hypothetical protein